MNRMLYRVLSFLVSFGVHTALLFLLYRMDVAQHTETWSGGRGWRLNGVMVTVGDPKGGTTSPAAQQTAKTRSEPPPPSNQAIVQKSATLPKAKMVPVPRDPEVRQTSKEVSEGQSEAPRADAGIGDSNTPAGGIGPGLDAHGTISHTAPSVLALIRKKIAAKKRYPILARDRRLEGRVSLTIHIQPDGSVAAVEIRQSSGHSLLDQAAIKSVYKAAPLPYYSAPIHVSLDFDLE